MSQVDNAGEQWFYDGVQEVVSKLRAELDAGYKPKRVDTMNGSHKVYYDTDLDGDDYAVIGYKLPEGVYAELSDATYGTLQGFRIYFRANKI